MPARRIDVRARLTRAQLGYMKQAGGVVAAMLAAVREAIRPGVTPLELDQIAADVIASAGALSNFKGYHGYPNVLCVSVNEQVVHGIPDDRPFEIGDVVSVDGGASVAAEGKRWHGDSAFTQVVGSTDVDTAALVDVTREALWSAIAALVGAKSVAVVGDAVETVLEHHKATTGREIAILQDYVGHGIGTEMHLPPEVVNYRVRPYGPRLKDGMCLAVEPILTLGTGESRVLADDWTVVTSDGKNAAHWEHSVALVGGGVHVLTAPDGGAAELAAWGITPVEL